MLVHICCSVDSHYFIEELRKTYPDEKIIGYFYDPNIHPLSEYELRFLDVKDLVINLVLSFIKVSMSMKNGLMLCVVMKMSLKRVQGVKFALM